MKDRFPTLKKITSAENGKYKTWQKLLSRKYREREGSFLVEGELLIKDAVSSSANLKEIIFRSGFDYTDFLNDIVLADNPSVENISFYELSDNLFDKIASTENGRSIIGVFSIPKCDMESFKHGDLVVLDRLQDPGNVGTIIRTSDAAGVSGIIAIKGTVDVFSPKVVRAAAGSVFRVPIAEVEDAKELVDVLKKLGIKPISIDPRGGKMFYDMPPDERLAIIVGNEGGGISKEILEISEMNLMIPMREGIESLNAAMALGIVIYERVRRRCKKD